MCIAGLEVRYFGGWGWDLEHYTTLLSIIRLYFFRMA